MYSTCCVHTAQTAHTTQSGIEQVYWHECRHCCQVTTSKKVLAQGSALQSLIFRQLTLSKRQIKMEGLAALIGKSLGLVSVSRLKVPRLSVSYKIFEVVSSRMKNFQTVSSQSRLVYFNFTQSRLDLVLIWMCSFQK